MLVVHYRTQGFSSSRWFVSIYKVKLKFGLSLKKIAVGLPRFRFIDRSSDSLLEEQFDIFTGQGGTLEERADLFAELQTVRIGDLTSKTDLLINGNNF